MMKKSIKIKPEERTKLVEFLVTKRVKYLEYLSDIHSEDGALWMNTIALDRAGLASYFGVPADCVATPSGSADAGGDGAQKTAGLLRLPVDATYEMSRGAAHGATGESPSGAPSTPAGTHTSEHTYVSFDKLPNPASIARDSSIAEWHTRMLPTYTAFAMSLSELLLIPVSGEEFLECFYHLLLEVDVSMSGGLATKALAQRNLRTLRGHMSEALMDSLASRNDGDVQSNQKEADVAAPAADATLFAAAGPNGTVGASSSAVPDQPKFIFLQANQVAYTAGTPSYDAVMPALFASLIFAYRRLCDYDLTSRVECLKRILSIDKHIERFVFARLGKELENLARQRLMRETYVLSTNGLFTELDGGGLDVDFMKDIFAASQQIATSGSAPKAATEGSASGKHPEESTSSSDLEDLVEAE